jgi:hypothetical protein
MAGGAPDNGRGYLYGGYDDLQCTVWKVVGDTETQIRAMYTERLTTDQAGTPTPQQPESHNALWAPTPQGDGGREYLTIIDEPYSATPDPQYMVDGLFFTGEFPALYGGWLRLRGTSAVIDPADKFVMFWTDLGHGGAASAIGWADVDGDADPDLYLANGDGSNRLFRNLDGDDFAEWYGELNDSGASAGFAWGDIDNDQDLDLYLATIDGDNLLFRNDGELEFVDIADATLAGAGNSIDVTWVDYDLDGDVDLFLVNTDGANRLLRSDGGGLFVDVTAGPLLEDPGASRDAAWADVEGDGDPDLYLANVGANKLLRNDGGVFVDVTAGPLGDALSGAATAWGDYDNDLGPDLYLVNADGANRLFRNQGGGVFTDVTAPPVGDAGPGSAASWIDIDQDADLDLYLVNLGAANKVFQNDGGGVFVEVEIDPLIDDTDDGVDAAWGDYDLDGDVDVYLANQGENRLLRNDIELTRWLHIDLVGNPSNAFGVGARILVHAGGVTQLREVSINDGNSLTAEFGLGGATVIDQVVVHWPSGTEQTLLNLGVNQRVTVAEQDAVPVELTSFEAVGEVGRVVLQWRASSAVDHAGFHIWRAPAAGDPSTGGSTAGEAPTGEVTHGAHAPVYTLLTDALIRGDGPYRFVDDAIEAGRVYLYRLEARDLAGGTEYFGPVRGAALARPLTLVLHQNVPNPFNPATSIGFELPAPADVRLTIYDIQGRVVRLLASGRRAPGAYEIMWDGRNALGQAVGSGVYLYRLEVDDWQRTRKMLLIR